MKVKIIFFSFLLLFPGVVFANDNVLSEEFQVDLYVAKVLELVDEKKYDDTIVQIFNIEILSEEFEGLEVQIKNTLTGNENDLILKENSRINVVHENIDGEDSFYIHSHEKSYALILLLIIFLVIVIILGRMKGVKALLSLIITILLIIYGFIPLLLNGHDPILLSIVTCVLATIITFVITNGFTKKSLIACIGVVGGLLIAGLFAYIFSGLMNLTGVLSESEQMLYHLPGDVSFDFKGLLFAGILIGALGACIDVAMELTSAMIEIKVHNPKIKNNELVKSGFNIGKDIMGTMFNTLILAYTGGSLSTILLYVGFDKSFSEIINLESISAEVLRSISGSIGLLFSIPITIFVFILINGKKEKND